MINMAKVVKGALEVLGLTRKTEANGKNLCELEQAIYDKLIDV
jgi:hypothetical protein